MNLGSDFGAHPSRTIGAVASKPITPELAWTLGKIAFKYGDYRSQEEEHELACRRAHPDSLTEEEALVLDALFHGATWRLIAEHLGITEQGARKRYRRLLSMPPRPYDPPSTH
jgi:FixJ family two-component response regulator